MPLPGQQSAALQMVEKLLALTDQFSPALVQARASAPDSATKTARSSLWKELSLYGMTDCFGSRSIRGSIISAPVSDTGGLAPAEVVRSKLEVE